VLVGSAQFIESARQCGPVKQLGAAFNAGEHDIAAACGLYALEHNYDRVREDNDNAALLAAGLRQVGFIVNPVESNILVCHCKTGQASAFVAALSDRCGVKVLEMDESSIRAVLNLHVTREHVQEVCKMIEKDEVLRGFC
jgi:threonine aldolase